MWASASNFLSRGGEAHAEAPAAASGSSKRKSSKKNKDKREEKRDDGRRGGSRSAGTQDPSSSGVRRTNSGTILPNDADLDLDTIPADLIPQTLAPPSGSMGIVLSPDLQGMVDEGAITMAEAMELAAEMSAQAVQDDQPYVSRQPSGQPESLPGDHRDTRYQRFGTNPALHYPSEHGGLGDVLDDVPIPGDDNFPPQGTQSSHDLPPPNTLGSQHYPSLPAGNSRMGFSSPPRSRQESFHSQLGEPPQRGSHGSQHYDEMPASLGSTRPGGRSRFDSGGSQPASRPKPSTRQQRHGSQQSFQQPDPSASSQPYRQPQAGRRQAPSSGSQSQRGQLSQSGRGGGSAGGGSVPGFAGGRLRLRVLRAVNLRNTALGVLPDDLSDPFVVAKVGRQEFKTEVVQNNLSPVWNSRNFDFAIEDEDARLELEVFNAQQWHAHDSLGRLELRVAELTPGKKEVKRDVLDEGDAFRDDGKRASLEVEVLYLTMDQLAGGGAVIADYGQGLAGLPAKEQKVKNWVPLPSFAHLGPEAFAAPAPEASAAAVGEQRRLMGQYSRACRLGQYDYSAPPDYNPNQEEVDKRRWKDDPFYGWRREINRAEHSAPQPMLADSMGDGLMSRRGGQERGILAERNSGRDDQQELEVWKRDPFHGWLNTDKSGHPENNLEKVQEAAVARQLMRLPSFRDADRRRFSDHREYASTQEAVATTRGRWTDPRAAQETGAPTERRWKEDAFFGWLPGRGPDSQQEHVLQRPLHLARDNRLPSFSEAPELLGVAGSPEAVGVLSVWINGACDLRYDDSTGLRGKPSACARVRVGGKEKVSPTVPMDADPRWNTPAMTFEVEPGGDLMSVEVVDLANPRSEDHIHQYFLGSVELSLEDLQERGLVPGERVRCREPLHGAASERAELDFEVVFEPYSDGAAPSRRPQASTRGGRHPRSLRDDHQRSHRDGHRDDHQRSHRDRRSPVGSRAQSFSRLNSGGSAGGYPTHRDGLPSQRESFASHREQPSRRVPPTTRSEASFRTIGSDMPSCGTISARVLRGFDLVNKDTGYRGDVSDPFVSIRLLSSGERNRKRTITIQNDLNPVWNTDPFLFQVNDIQDSVIFEVWDENMLSEPDFLGKLAIPLSIFAQADRFNKALQIREKLEGVDHGELLVEIGFSPD